MANGKLYLIDGHALAYRMFFALPLEAFSTRAGEPTNATYGFTRALIDLVLADDPPTYLAVSFDVGKTFRDDIFPDYKGTRAKTPEELHQQVDRIREVVAAFNIPVIEQEGYEADDVLGTLARQASQQGVKTLVLTGDRDLLQLVTDEVHILLAGRRGNEEYGPAEVVEKFGIRPDQIVDYKAMVGDSSDNIPGVRGVGDKTAVKLLQQYETLDAIYEHLDEVKSTRFRTALENGRKEADLSRELAQIITDVPVSLDLEACRTHDFDRSQVVKLLHELEFRSLGDRFRETAPVPGQQLGLFDAPGTKPDNQPGTATTIVRTAGELEELVARLSAAKVISFDTETTGVDEMTAELVGVALSTQAGEGAYIPVGHVLSEEEQNQQLPVQAVVDAIRPAMTDASQYPRWLTTPSTTSPCWNAMDSR